MALLEEVSPSPKVIRCPRSSEKGVRLVRAREKGVELGENTSVGTRRDTKVFQTSSLTIVLMNLNSSHLIPSHLVSPHLVSSHLIVPHLISSLSIASTSNGAEEQCCDRPCARTIADGDATRIRSFEVAIFTSK